jgi:hypothetical protein
MLHSFARAFQIFFIITHERDIVTRDLLDVIYTRTGEDNRVNQFTANQRTRNQQNFKLLSSYMKEIYYSHKKFVRRHLSPDRRG